MIVYSWTDFAGAAEDNYYTSLERARSTLKSYLKTGKEGDWSSGVSLGPIEIVRLNVGTPTKERVVAMLNHEGFVEERECVEKWGAVPCGKCEMCLNYGPEECSAKKVVKA